MLIFIRALSFCFFSFVLLCSCSQEISSSADSALERDMLNETIKTQGLEYAAF